MHAETDKIWMNGELVDWADATVHVGAHGLHYGTGVFEGIRCYETEKGPAVFRLTDHLERLHNSARSSTWTSRTRSTSCRPPRMELIGGERAARVLPAPDRLLRLRRARRLDRGQPGRDGDHELAVGRVPRRRGAEERDPRARSRPGSASGRTRFPHASKATGIYLNSMLAVTEANRAGYDEAILLTADGYIADGSGENVFVVKDGKIATPPLSTSILPGHHARLGDPDRAGPRLHRRGEEHHPVRPLDRRRGLHDRDRGRGDADPRGRRPRDRPAGAGDEGAPDRVPRHVPRQERALGAVARVREDRERGTAEA